VTVISLHTKTANSLHEISRVKNKALKYGNITSFKKHMAYLTSE
jgi:hypothetical protein